MNSINKEIFLIKTLILFFSGFFALQGVILSSDKYFFGRELIKSKDFEMLFFKYSVPFAEYDSLKNQFDNFFGYTNPVSNNRHFQDLSIAKDSFDLRLLYNAKIFEMTRNKKNNKIYPESFFNDKLK